MQLTSYLGFPNLVVESDSLTVVKMLATKMEVFPEQRFVIADKKSLATGFQIIEFCHTPHEVNTVAHSLARSSKHVNDTKLW